MVGDAVIVSLPKIEERTEQQVVQKPAVREGAETAFISLLATDYSACTREPSRCRDSAPSLTVGFLLSFRSFASTAAPTSLHRDAFSSPIKS